MKTYEYDDGSVMTKCSNTYRGQYIKGTGGWDWELEGGERLGDWRWVGNIKYMGVERLGGGKWEGSKYTRMSDV